VCVRELLRFDNIEKKLSSVFSLTQNIWLDALLLVSRIKEAIFMVINVTFIIACSLHATQSFLYFRGCHVKDTLTCMS
jgi:hypothetical protein